MLPDRWASDWGWSDFFERQLKEEDRQKAWLPARVVEEQKGHFRLSTPAGEVWGETTGRLKLEARKGALWPAVGDWVLAEPQPGAKARIDRVLERRTKISRAAAGEAVKEQVM